MNPQLTKYARETEISISLARRESRQPMFPLCPLLPVNTLMNEYPLFINVLLLFLPVNTLMNEYPLFINGLLSFHSCRKTCSYAI